MGLFLACTTLSFAQAPYGGTALYIRGSLVGSWDALDQNVMTHVSGTNTYTVTVTIDGPNEFKIADSTWGIVNLGGGDDYLDPAFGISTINMERGANPLNIFAELPAGTYTFTLDATDTEAPVLTVAEGSGGGGGETPDFRMAMYTLNAMSNAGAVPNGVAATATFREISDSTTLVTLTLTAGPTGTAVSHVAHIHHNDAATGGGIAYHLGPIDGNANGPGSSDYLVNQSFDALVAFNGYINIHESAAALGNIVSQGNIGSNATADVVASDLTPIADPRSMTYPLSARTNEGAIPSGVEATATFTEMTADLTLVQLQLLGGATGAAVSHVAHIHNNPAAQGGGIAYFLGPIDGMTAASGGSFALVNASFDTLTAFNGHINIHESGASLANVVARGNIGSAYSGIPASLPAALSTSFAYNDAASPTEPQFFRSLWFGIFYGDPATPNWIYSIDHGWVYVWPGQNTGSMWLWHTTIGQNLFLNASTPGYIYSPSLGWLYYPQQDVFNTSVRLFWSFASQDWITIDLANPAA